VSLFLNWFRQLAMYGKVSPADYAALDHVYRTKEEVRSMLVATLERERRSIYQEGLVAGREEGREEGLVAGREEGVEAQQQVLVKLLQWRFALSAQEQANLAQQIAAIADLPRLTGLVDLALAAGSVQDFLAQMDRPGDAVDAG
jgi:hypothetical protein